jgi:hypothetical protein
MNKIQRRIVMLYVAAIVALTFFAPTKWWHQGQQMWLKGGRNAIWYLGGYYKVDYAQFLLELGIISLVAYVLILLKRDAAISAGQRAPEGTHVNTPPAP